MHAARLDLCSRLPGYEFVVPDHVREEITDANQRMALDDAVVRSVFRIEAITDLSAITRFTELIAHNAQAPVFHCPSLGDPDDDQVIACAIAARGDLIISGDRHLRNVESHQGIRIVSSDEALRLVTQ